MQDTHSLVTKGKSTFSVDESGEDRFNQMTKLNIIYHTN